MRGIDNFVRSLKETGADGLIVPDLPPEEIEAEDYFSSCEQHKLHPILIFAPSCGDERLKFLNHVKTLLKADRTAQDSVNHDASGSATVSMYPGHGSHYYHMGKELYSNDQAFKHAFDQCGETVADLAGFSLAHIVYQQSNPFQDFNETRATHPACFAFNYAMYKTLEAHGLRQQLPGPLLQYFSQGVSGWCFQLDNVTLVHSGVHLLLVVDPARSINRVHRFFTQSVHQKSA